MSRGLPVTNRVRGEEGIAMVLVITISMLLLAASILAFAMATRSLSASQEHVRFEQRLHLAEQGIDQTLALIQANNAYVHQPPGFNGSLPIAQLDQAALDAFEAGTDADLDVQSARDGQYAVIKPAGRNVVYSRAWIPSRAAASFTRTVKVEYLLSTFAAQNAILTGGDLQIQGATIVGGNAGSVHSNGDIDFVGNSYSISEQVSATGSISGNTSNVGGGTTAGADPQDIPPVEPRDIYTLNRLTYSGEWWDLCSDGTVHQPGSTPCQGPLEPTFVVGNEFRGWDFNLHPTNGPVWSASSDAGDYPGVYYVFGGSADISGGPGSDLDRWATTIITEGAPIAGEPCKKNFGDIFVSGSPKMTTKIDGLQLVAGRDLLLTGSSSGGGAGVEGLLAAQEQVELSGNVSIGQPPPSTVGGAVVAEDRCDTDSSPVHTNDIDGSITIYHDDSFDVPLNNLIRSVLWLEMR